MPRRTRRPPEPRTWRGRAGSGPARETPRARPALPRGSSSFVAARRGFFKRRAAYLRRAARPRETERKDFISFLKHARRDVALRTPPTHSLSHVLAPSRCRRASRPVAARAPRPARTRCARGAPSRARRVPIPRPMRPRASVADRLRGAAVATAAAAALVACAPDAALANAFDGDLSPTNGPLKSLPKGARAPPPPRVPSRDLRSFLVQERRLRTSRASSGWANDTRRSTRSAASAEKKIVRARRTRN